MNQLYVLLVFGAVLLALFVAALVMRAMGKGFAEAPSAPAIEAVDFLALPGLNFPNSRLLFARDDYDFLCSAPSLVTVARELRSDRKRLVGMWLRMLQKDLLELWRFRRFLSSHGLTSGLREEAGIAASAMAMLATLACLRVAVAAAGPFAVVDLLQAGPRMAESFRAAGARAFAQLPSGRMDEVRAAWLGA